MINSRPYEYYGCKLISLQGYRDMPKRLGDIFYDWGDEIQPLVHKDDISYDGRLILLRLFVLGNINDAINKLKDLEDFELTHEGETYNVRIVQSQDAIKYLDTNEITLQLWQSEVPFKELSEREETGRKSNGIWIDEYNLLTDFGLILKKSDLPTISSAKKNNVTTYQKPITYSNYRVLEEMTLSFIADKYADLESFQALLALSGLRKLTMNGSEYKVFHSAGFKVDEMIKVIVFDVKLNIYEVL